MAREYNSGATGHEFKVGNTLRHKLTATGSYTGGVVMDKTTTTTISATGATTLTAAQMLTRHLLCTAASTPATWTTPTAALLVAAATQLKPPRAGETAGGTFELLIRNTGDQTLTLVAGSGCTIVAAALDTITTGKSLLFRVQIVTATVGSEAYSMFPLGNAYTP